MIGHSEDDSENGVRDQFTYNQSIFHSAFFPGDDSVEQVMKNHTNKVNYSMKQKIPLSLQVLRVEYFFPDRPKQQEVQICSPGYYINWTALSE